MRLSTIGLIGFLALPFLSVPLDAEAQQTEKVYQIGWPSFFPGPNPPTGPTHIAFRQRLRELGYIEGENLVIEYRSAEGKRERRPEIAAELVRLKVDVIVTSGAPGLIRIVQGATRTIPIVSIGIRVDPVKAGLVKSLARPGGNLTGITNLKTDLHGKRLELLKEAFPGISRVAILWPQHDQEQGIKDLEAAGRALGIQIHSVVVEKRPGGFDSAFSTIGREHVDALLVDAPWLMNRHKARMMAFTAKRRLPAIYTRSRYVDAGGLMSYGTNLAHLSRQGATYVDKIFKGAKPADLPVERPTKFDLVINLKTAKQLGITIPPSILYRADKVIK